MQFSLHMRKFAIQHILMWRGLLLLISCDDGVILISLVALVLISGGCSPWTSVWLEFIYLFIYLIKPWRRLVLYYLKWSTQTILQNVLNLSHTSSIFSRVDECTVNISAQKSSICVHRYLTVHIEIFSWLPIIVFLFISLRPTSLVFLSICKGKYGPKVRVLSSMRLLEPSPMTGKWSLSVHQRNAI